MSVLEKQIFTDNTGIFDRLRHFDQGSDEWHKARTGIGSSEAAAVFPGVSTTVTPADLRAKLAGEPRKEPNDYLKSLFAEGSHYEPILRRELEQILDCWVIESGIFVLERGAGQPHLSASLDGIGVQWRSDGPPRTVIVEFKWRCGNGAGWGEHRDKLGMTVWCQVQHQMRVAGVGSAVVYSGARDGDRRMWLIKKAPAAYFCMWDAFEHRLHAQVAGEESTRARNGQTASIKKQLHRFMLQTVLAERRRIIPTNLSN